MENPATCLPRLIDRERGRRLNTSIPFIYLLQNKYVFLLATHNARTKRTAPVWDASFINPLPRFDKRRSRHFSFPNPVQRMELGRPTQKTTILSSAAEEEQ